MEIISQGIKRTWSNEQNIVIYTASILNLQNLTAWEQAVSASLQTWPKGKSYRALHDISLSGLSLKYLALTGYKILAPWLTPNGERVFRDWLLSDPKRRVRLAVVVSTALSGEITTLRGRVSTPLPEQIESRIFNDRTVALQWLSQADEAQS